MKLYSLLLALLTFSGASFAQLRAEFTTAKFNSPEGPFIENYLNIKGYSAAFEALDTAAFQAKVEVTYILKDAEGQVFSFDKYQVQSPVVYDTLASLVDFSDVKRFSVPNNKPFTIDIVVRDLVADSSEPLIASTELEVNFQSDSIQFSDLEHVDKAFKANETDPKSDFQKNGFVLVPKTNNFYHEYNKRISFYFEFYNAQKVLGADADYLLNYYVALEGRNSAAYNLRSIKRLKATEVQPFLGSFSLEKVPSGNYDLVVEVIDRENNLIARNRWMFQRSNPNVQIDINELLSQDVSATFVTRMAADSLADCIAALNPISTDNERKFVLSDLAGADLAMRQKYFYTFWSTRNAADPESEWIKYREQLDLVNRFYATPIKRGWETDRGRVYLQYGAPNTITARTNEPTNYPYEIWHYYNLPMRSNAKFVFYNRDLGVENYELLHSNVLGEMNNYRWRYILAQRGGQLPNLDDEAIEFQDHFGNRVDEFFEMPR